MHPVHAAAAAGVFLRRLGCVQGLPPTGEVYFRACSMCHKAFQISQLRENVVGRNMCHDCAPEAWPYRCTACKRHKTASGFQQCRSDLETAFHTRCKSCESCIECKRCLADHRSMAPDTSLCTKCFEQSKLKTCTVCGEGRTNILHRSGKKRGGSLETCISAASPATRALRVRSRRIK